MPEETTVIEQPAAPSLAEAYAAGSNSDKHILTEGKRKPERGGNERLSEEKDTARETGEGGQRAEHANVKREPTLAEAFENVEPAAAEQFELPAAFAAYSADDISAVCGLLGLEESDLTEPRFAALALKELEASFQQSEEGEEEEDDPEPEVDEGEEEEEKKPEEKPEDAKPVESKADPRLTQYTGDEMRNHIDGIWQRMEESQHPQMVDAFTGALASQLAQVPANEEERVKLVGDAVKLLTYGGCAMIESAMPRMIQSYLEQNVMAIFQQVLPHAMEGYAPGFQQSYTNDMLSRTWDSVRGNDLPKFGTPEFQELANEVHEKHPFLNDIDFKDSKGKPLPLMDALHAKAELTARLCRGERVTPQTIQDAVARGKADAARSNRRVSASRALGKGRTTGTMGPAEKPATSLRDAYTAQHGNSGI